MVRFLKRALGDVQLEWIEQNSDFARLTSLFGRHDGLYQDRTIRLLAWWTRIPLVKLKCQPKPLPAQACQLHRLGNIITPKRAV
jgi:hypothetical protein